MLLVVDDGWASAGDWPRRMAAADAVLDRAERATAARPRCSPPRPPTPAPRPPCSHRDAGDRPCARGSPRCGRSPGRSIAPPPPARCAPGAAATRAAWCRLSRRRADRWRRSGRATFRRGAARRRAGDGVARSRRRGAAAAAAGIAGTDALGVRVAAVPRPQPRRQLAVLAQTGDGRTLARAAAHAPRRGHRQRAEASLTAPLRNPPTGWFASGLIAGAAAGPVLRRRGACCSTSAGAAGRSACSPATPPTADTPLLGPLYYLRRALAPYTEVREGDLDALLSARPLGAGAGRPRRCRRAGARRGWTAWVRQGRAAGALRRAARPRRIRDAAAAGAAARRATGNSAARCPGASRPGWRAFPPGSPFAGLAVPADVRVTRPGAGRAGRASGRGQTWARAGRRHAAGDRGAARAPGASCCSTSPPTPTGRTCRCRACSSRCCAGWWRCRPASPPPPAPPRWRRPRRWTGSASWSPPPLARRPALPADEIAATPASPRHPPGLYGPENGRRALNLGASIAAARGRAAHRRRARSEPIGGRGAGTRARRRGCSRWRWRCWRFDLLISLGAARPAAPGGRGAAAAPRRCAAPRAQAVGARSAPRNPSAALHTRARLHRHRRRAGRPHLARGAGRAVRLRERAHRRDAAARRGRGQPGQDDLSFYPLLYWPITADASADLVGAARSPRSTTTCRMAASS